MIKVEKDEVFGLSHAIRGMRNPLNSWSMSDSKWDGFGPVDGYSVGPNDYSLMERLVKGGSDHSKFMRMITVYMDITAPLYWWKEFDTYKVGTVANSCSTMHKIHDKEFELNDFSYDRLMRDGESWNIAEEYAEGESPLAVLEYVIAVLNFYRNKFIETKNKRYWWQMIQLLPSSYNQKRTVMLNYAVLRNMYHARKNHKLDEWRKFCEWIETYLPYSDLITRE